MKIISFLSILFMLGAQALAEFQFIPISNDADSDISADNTYTHAIDFGNQPGGNPLANVNGVQFANGNPGAFPGTVGSGTVGTGSSTIPNTHNGNGGHNTSGAVSGLFGDMIFNDATADIQLTGLTPGVTYDFRYYMRQWGAGTRTQDFLFDGNGDGAFENTIRISEDNATLDPPGLATSNQAYAFSFTYTAGASGTLNLKVNMITGGTFHLYGLTNQVVVNVADADGDGLPDDFEAEHTDPESVTALNATDDLDNDGLTDLQEFESGTNPNNADTDGDGLDDGDEIAGAGSRPATDPNNVDSDGDGLSDFSETNTGVFAGATDTGTDPAVADTDGDGAADGEEVAAGSDPLDATDIPPLPDGFALTGPLTDDASSGIDPANDYTHAISGGGVETVNGVTFDLLDRATRPLNFEWSASSQQNMINDNNGGWNVAASGVSGPGLLGLFGSFTYNHDGNAGSNQTFTLSALTPGQIYETRLYMRKWDNSTARRQTATFTAGGQSPSSITFFEDHPEKSPTALPNRDSAWYLSYTYTADASGTLAIRFEVQPSGVVQGNPGSFHLYGLTNQVASAPAPLEITDISYNAATSSLSIVFNSQPGANYALDYSTTLKEGDWQELDDGIIAEGSQTTVVDNFLIPNLPKRAWLRVRKVE
jgi:hypothetical protein